MSTERFPMGEDRILGDGGNVTVYERPDGSRYALDQRGQGEERTAHAPVFGRARFDSRELASGRWAQSRSAAQQAASTRPEPQIRRHRAT